MRILYSHRTRSADGQYVHIRALTEALRARGCDIAMVGPSGEDVSSKPLNAGGGSLRGLLPKPLYECAEYGYSFPAYWRLARAAERFKPDILYERYNLFYHAGAWLRRRLGLPMILEVNAPLAEERARHGGLALKRFAKRSEERLWRAADMVLPVCHVLAERVCAAGVSKEKIRVIHNGVEDAFLAPQDPGDIRSRYGVEGKCVLGFIGFVRDWHGLDRAVKFLAKSGRRDLHLLMVGDGPAVADLKALAASHGVSDQITATGVIEREEAPAHIAAFDVALQPAVVDYASPLKLFEYMALGKPIIAPDAANIREVLRDGVDGVLFGEDESAFDAALGALIDDRERCARLGEAARARLIEQDFTWSGNARRIEEIANGLLKGAS